MFDGLYPPGLQWYWKADFVNELSDEAIARHVEFGSQLPTPQSGMHLYPIDGAAGRVPKDATAWNWRGARWAQVMVGVSPDPADNERMIAWARAYWEALHPHSAGGAYVNMMMDEGQERVRAAYGANYDRLAAIKAQVRPEQPLPHEPEHRARGRDEVRTQGSWQRVMHIGEASESVRRAAWSRPRACSASARLSWPPSPCWARWPWWEAPLAAPVEPDQEATVARFYDAVNNVVRASDVSVLDGVVSPDFVFHSGADGVITDRAGLVDMLLDLHSIAPAFQLTVEELIMAGGRAIAHLADEQRAVTWLGVPWPSRHRSGGSSTPSVSG